jgi:hypothetical protein
MSGWVFMFADEFSSRRRLKWQISKICDKDVFKNPRPYVGSVQQDLDCGQFSELLASHV